MKQPVRAFGLLLVMALCMQFGPRSATAQESQPVGPPFYRPHCDAGVGFGESSWGYRTGWNLIADPTGQAPDGTAAPFYTLQAGDSDYEVVQDASLLEPGIGYWAYFSKPGGIMLGPVRGLRMPYTFEVPAGQWVLIGNPFTRVANLTGEDAAERYVPGSGYQDTGFFHPGEALWIYSQDGGTLAISNGAQCS